VLCKGAYFISIFQKKRFGVCGLDQLLCYCLNIAFPVAAAKLYETRVALLPLGCRRSDGPSLALRVLTLQIKKTSIQHFFFSYATHQFPSPPRQPTLLSKSADSFHERFCIQIHSTTLCIEASFTVLSPFHFPSLSTSVNRKDVLVSLHLLYPNELVTPSVSLTICRKGDSKCFLVTSNRLYLDLSRLADSQPD